LAGLGFGISGCDGTGMFSLKIDRYCHAGPGGVWKNGMTGLLFRCIENRDQANLTFGRKWTSPVDK